MAPSLSQMSNISTGSQAGGSGGGMIGLGVTSGLMGASPANLLSFTSPAGLTGLDMGTPSGLLGADGSHAMNISLSDLGISSSSRRGNEDEERRAKLESVLAKLHGRRGGRDDVRKADRFGRVSEEGVRRVGCWVGMDIESDKKEMIFEGNRQISVAGKSAVLIDVRMSLLTEGAPRENQVLTTLHRFLSRTIFPNLLISASLARKMQSSRIKQPHRKYCLTT